MIFTSRARRIAIASLGLLFPLQSFAAIRTWDAGGADTNWSTAQNWSDDTIPRGTDTALFDGTGQTDSYIDASFVASGGTIQTTSAFTGSIFIRRNYTVNDHLLLSGGTLDMSGSGYRLVVRKNWVNDGATFEAGTGTVLLAGTGSHTLKESASLYDLSLNDGLIGHWTFDEGAGAVAEDVSGYARHGTLIGAPTWTETVPATSYQNTSALTFTGGSEYVALGGANDFNPGEGAFTWTIWFKTTDDGLGGDFGYRALLEFSGNSGTWSANYDSKIILRNIEGRIGSVFSRKISGQYYQLYVTSSQEVNDGAWHNAVMTWDCSSKATRLYLDGVLQGTATEVDMPNCFAATPQGTRCSPGDHTLVAGLEESYGCVSRNKFIGSLDDIRVYNRVLSAEEAARLAAGNQPQTSIGTYTLASNLDVNGSLTLTAGTLDVSSSNYGITVSGSWLNYGGVLNARDGSVSFDGSSNTLQGGSESFATLNIDEDTTINGITTVTDDLSIDVSKTLALSFDLTASAITNNGLIVENDGGIIHASTLSVSPPAFIIGDSLFVTVRDSDANVNGTAQDTITATVNGQSLTLTETTATSGIFQGSLPMNGNLTVCSSVSIVYADPQDSSDVRSATSLVIDGNGRCGSGDGGSGGGGGGGGRRTSPTSLSSSSAPTTSAPSATSVPSATSRFSDTPPSAWFTPYVQEVTQRGIFSGYEDEEGNLTGEFGPSDPVTVGQILKIALLSAGHELPSPPSVPRNATAINDWSAPYVALGESLSLALSSEDVLRPATRGEVISTLLQSFDLPLSSSSTHPFIDLPADHPNAEAIAAAYALNLVTGDTDAEGNPLNTVRPDDLINRAEVAVLVVRLLEHFDR